MQFIKAADPAQGMHAMAERISSALIQGKNVLWLICGGSNISTAVRAMNEIRKVVPEGSLELLTVAQTDERYGPVGHPDSNWKQMIDDGFNFDGINTVSILRDLPLHETVTEYWQEIQPVFEKTLASAGSVIAQFGMGEDGHIAGILPHTPAAKDEGFVSGYVSEPFTRISLSPPALLKITAAYAFVFGASKRAAVRRLRDESVPLDDEPAQILKNFSEAYLYSDQL